MTNPVFGAGRSDVRRAMRLSHAAAVLLVLTCGQASAAPKPPLNVAVAPSRVTAGATGTTLTFTFTATSSTSSTVFVTIPAPLGGTPWSAPQTSSPNAAGYVSTNAGNCNSVGVPSVSGTSPGPWTLAIPWKCAINKSFTLVYRTTAAARAAQYTFASQVTVGKQSLPLAPQPVVTVGPGAATSLGVAGPSSAVAGVPQNVTVTARDAFANVATGYTGTVQFTSSDTGSELPDDYTFVASDNGVHTFASGVTLATAGPQTVTATDTAHASITGFTTITVTPGPAASLELGGIVDAVAGTAQSATVTAFDAFGNVATGYEGTVHFASNDPKALLPGYASDAFGGVFLVQDYTFTSADAGTHTFANGVVLKTVVSPNSLVTVTDVDDASLTSSQQAVVSAGPTSHVTIGLPFSKNNYPAWSGFGVSLTFCGAAATDQYDNPTHPTLTWSSTDPAALLPPNGTAPINPTQCNFATVGLQTVTVADASNPAVKATDTVNVTGGPHAHPDDVTLLDPSHTFGVTRWPINVLRNDDQVKLDVFNPFLDFYNTIYSVTQATYSDNGTLYQVGLMSVSGDLHFVVWDLDPPGDVVPTVPGAQMKRCPPPDEQGMVSSVCNIAAPITTEYTMTDGANFVSAALTLHLETPDTPVTPRGSTTTDQPIKLSSDASKQATMSPQAGINMPVLQTIMLTPTTSTPTTTLIGGGFSATLNLSFNNTVASSNGSGCTGGLQNCTVSMPATTPVGLTGPGALVTLASQPNSSSQAIVYPSQPESLRYNFAAACNVATSQLYDIWNPPNGGNCSVNSDCDTVVNNHDGVCTQGTCTQGLVPPTCSANSDCDTAPGRGDGVCGAVGRCTAGQVPTRCSNVPVAPQSVLPPAMTAVQILLPSDPNHPTVQFSMLAVFNFIAPIADVCHIGDSWCEDGNSWCQTGSNCASGCCCNATQQCTEVATCTTDPFAVCQ